MSIIELKERCHDKKSGRMWTKPKCTLPRTRKNLTKKLNVSSNSIANNEMIAQMINQMPSVYENKVDHIKHQIDSGIEMTLVEVLGHLRDKYMSL